MGYGCLLDGGAYAQDFLGCYSDFFYRWYVWGLLGIARKWVNSPCRGRFHGNFYFGMDKRFSPRNQLRSSC